MRISLLFSLNWENIHILCRCLWDQSLGCGLILLWFHGTKVRPKLETIVLIKRTPTQVKLLDYTCRDYVWLSEELSKVKHWLSLFYDFVYFVSFMSQNRFLLFDWQQKAKVEPCISLVYFFATATLFWYLHAILLHSSFVYNVLLFEYSPFVMKKEDIWGDIWGIFFSFLKTHMMFDALQFFLRKESVIDTI